VTRNRSAAIILTVSTFSFGAAIVGRRRPVSSMGRPFRKISTLCPTCGVKFSHRLHQVDTTAQPSCPRLDPAVPAVVGRAPCRARQYELALARLAKSRPRDSRWFRSDLAPPAEYSRKIVMDLAAELCVGDSRAAAVAAPALRQRHRRQ